jgi:NhaC family Na+:H+ antiporter
MLASTITRQEPMDPEPNASQQPGLLISATPLAVLVCLLAFNVYLFGDNALGGAHQLALLLTAGLTASLALTRGAAWQDLQTGMANSIRVAIPAILILLMVGSLSGTWLISGIVPAMIYYGLLVLNPVIFLFAACIISSLVSVATGSSWTTSATVGIALMGIGTALGIDPAMVAGAVLSGAYFGDKLSPLSDTTNLAAAVAGTELFTHIRYLTITTGPSIALALAAYLLIGWFTGTRGDSIDTNAIRAALQQSFHISAWLMLVPAAVIVMIVRRVAALPAIFVGMLLGAVAAVVFQPDVVASAAGNGPAEYPLYAGVMRAMFGDVAITTNNAVIDDLLTSAGMAGMLPTIWLILAAMVFGGTMESAGFLARITQSLLARAHSDRALITATAGTALVANTTASDQYLAIVVPGRMFSASFDERGLAPQNLSRTLEDAGTVTSVLIPWNTCGAYHAGVLGVATLSYAPFAFFCLASPLMTLLVAYLGIRIARNDKR